MPKPFVIGDEAAPIEGDAQCQECLEGYPEPCPCGGLIHAAAGEADETGTDWPLTRCDRCGRAEEELS